MVTYGAYIQLTCTITAVSVVVVSVLFAGVLAISVVNSFECHPGNKRYCIYSKLKTWTFI